MGSLFLWQDAALKNFAQAYVASVEEGFAPQISQKTWCVVCERKEDVIPVQQQLTFEINRLRPDAYKNQPVLGIGLFSLDDLAGLLCRALGLPPYLTLLEQEHAVEFCLNVFGYHGQDTAVLAKQILALLNVDFPSHISLFDVFKQALEDSSLGYSSQIKDLEEPTLKQIFATYHAMEEVFRSFSTFVGFAKTFHKNALADFKSTSTGFLTSQVLWVGAFCYTEDISLGENHLWGSPFPRHLVQTFKETFQSICREYRAHVPDAQENFWFESQVVLSPQLQQDFSLELKIFQDPNAFEEAVRFDQKDFLNTTCVLLGDLDEDLFKPLRHDAGGVYSFKNRAPEDIEQQSEILKLWEAFLDSFSFMKDFKTLENVARIYELPQQTLTEDYLQQIFLRKLQEKHWQKGPKPQVFQFPRALNRLAFAGQPEKLCLVGKPHRAVSSSFVVKRLTHLFYTLKRLGIEVETPKPTRTYELFWENVAHSGLPLSIWLPSEAEQALLSPRFALEKATHVDFIPQKPHPKLLTTLGHFYQKEMSLKVPRWSESLGQSQVSVSVTGFETFVRCPTQFYFSHVLGQTPEKEPFSVFNLDRLDLGTQVHLILEQCITRLLVEFQDEYLNKAPAFYEKILSVLIDVTGVHPSSDFHSPAYLMSHASDLSPGFQEFYREFCEHIFPSSQQKFTDVYRREALKRSLIRFFQAEQLYLKTSGLESVGIVREMPLAFHWNGVTFRGKIDRVDRYGEPITNGESVPRGVRIIDYKTSAYPTSKETLALFPSEISPKAHLSVQAALYSYGWAHTAATSDEDGVLSFSLYFLKGLDPDTPTHLTYNFVDPILPHSPMAREIEESYGYYVEKLKSGDFSPNPLQGSQTCQWCSFRNLCPKVSP